MNKERQIRRLMKLLNIFYAVTLLPSLWLVIVSTAMFDSYNPDTAPFAIKLVAYSMFFLPFSMLSALSVPWFILKKHENTALIIIFLPLFILVLLAIGILYAS